MNSLDEAWRWYENTYQQLYLMERLARRYWEQLPWEKVLDRDDHFRDLNSSRVEAGAKFSLAHLNDLAVVVLFSVFESIVRAQVLDELAAEEGHLRHRAIRKAVAEATRRGGEFLSRPGALQGPSRQAR
ncbi:MAG: hypothetical protein K2R98_04655 [Gemmataceae bacterium]|nr:hypothetical protein [Gemmataceae bacterium]